MNQKKCVLLLAAILLCVGAAAAQGLRAGEAAIYSGGGVRIIDRIQDISSTRLVLETANSGEIPLRDLWMINFVDDQWNFPEERNQITSNDHYVFLKNGSVAAGRIVDFSSEQRVFEFQSGEKFPIMDIRRIYFARNLPGDLADQLKKQELPPIHPTRFVGEYERIESDQGVILMLREDGTARMTAPRFPRGPAATRNLTRNLNGRWTATGENQVTLHLEPTPGGRAAFTYVFNREGDHLVGTGQVIETYGDLRLKRR
jgi:hypothetical protein